MTVATLLLIVTPVFLYPGDTVRVTTHIDTDPENRELRLEVDAPGEYWRSDRPVDRRTIEVFLQLYTCGEHQVIATVTRADGTTKRRTASTRVVCSDAPHSGTSQAIRRP